MVGDLLGVGEDIVVGGEEEVKEDFQKRRLLVLSECQLDGGFEFENKLSSRV